MSSVMRTIRTQAFKAAGFITVAIFMAAPNAIAYDQATNLSLTTGFATGNGYHAAGPSGSGIIEGSPIVAFEEDGIRGNDDVYVYDGRTGTSTNLSDLLPAGEGTGAAQNIIMAVNGTNYAVAWAETGASGLFSPFLYLSIDNSITTLSSAPPAMTVPGSYASNIGNIMLDSSGAAVVSWTMPGARGGTDQFIYDSASTTYRNLSDELPIGVGGNQALTADADSTMMAANRNYNVCWTERHTTNNVTRDLFCYSSRTDTIHSLSSLRAEGNSGSLGTYEALSDQSGILHVWWIEDNGTRGGDDAYYFNDAAGTVTNLSNQLPAGQGTSDAFSLYSADGGYETRDNIGLDSNGDVYVSWRERTGVTAIFDLYLYRGNPGDIINVSQAGPSVAGEGGAIGPGEMVVAPDDNVYITFVKEEAATFDYEVYLYDLNAGAYSKISTKVPLPTATYVSAVTMKVNGSSQPFVTWDSWPDNETDYFTEIYAYNGATDTTINLSTQVDPGDNDSIPYLLSDSSTDNVSLFWAQEGGARGGTDFYAYDFTDDAIHNVSNNLDLGEGTLDADGYAPHGFFADANTLYMVWPERGDSSNGNDVFLLSYSTSAPSPPPAADPPTVEDDSSSGGSSDSDTLAPTGVSVATYFALALGFMALALGFLRQFVQLQRS